MKKLIKYRIITVYCKCGQILIKYKKGPWRRLLKIHRDRITKDYNEIFIKDKSPVWISIWCPACKERLTTVQIVNWKYINKVNQWQLWIIRKS